MCNSETSISPVYFKPSKLRSFQLSLFKKGKYFAQTFSKTFGITGSIYKL